jgi:hypothetical protein
VLGPRTSQCITRSGGQLELSSKRLDEIRDAMKDEMKANVLHRYLEHGQVHLIAFLTSQAQVMPSPRWSPQLSNNGAMF